ncbi:PREDICTED: uncharacterized protein LOC109155346 [Ipomoea nil]|uniref:uncharacterized protein LOC109155346 n=1 Tax=Ipomoea nil TaxID=35883 RepID=UPI00090182E1|nr:PREDICTED: uncharacterized protein LOC109155346 [Ipomoea nil]
MEAASQQQHDEGVARIAERWSDMILQDEEDGVEAGGLYQPVEIEGGQVYSVVGRFLTAKLIKVEYMRHVMASAWMPVMGMRVTELQSNLFLFAFYHVTDMKRVLEEGPWSFENHTLVCRQVCDGFLPGEVKLDTVDMWIQVYDLPMGYTSKVVLEQVGNFVGTFIRCDDRNVGGPWKTFYRVRVSVPVDKPLKRRMKLIRRDKSWGWVNLKYERLHNFCFCCGLLGHLDKFCVKARVSGIMPESYPYGPWMRAGKVRGPRPVGASWLLPPVGGVIPTVAENKGGESVAVDDVVMVQQQHVSDEDVIASSKRRRAETTTVEGAETVMSGEVADNTVSKNLHTAGGSCFTDPPSPMSTLSWNCRGLGNPRTVREIEGMVSRKKPDFVYLMETKVGKDNAERLRVKLGFEGLFYVNPVRMGGGLALLWRKNNTARLISYSKNYIDLEISISGFPNWRMTCFYGYPHRSRRRDAWDLIKLLKPQSNLPWIMIGDFNDLLFQHEKRGGNPHPNYLLRGFGEVIEYCGMTQLPMEGYQFTWEKGKGTDRWMEERLDKVLATNTWRDSVPGARVTNILTRKSDHSFLFLGIHDPVGRGRPRQKQFRFEMAWVYDEGCRAVVEESWNEKRQDGLHECIAYYGKRLSRWGGDHYHKFGERIKQLRSDQLRLRGRTDSESLTEFQRLEEELSRVEAQEDAYWKQRAKQHWLKNADANTKFYHRVEEVRSALFAMFPDKAPGPDGMNLDFYQHFWDVVAGDLANYIVQCLNTRVFPSALNETNVVLIPKKDMPELVTDLRPIALSNVVYRVMAKMITQRMKPLMDSIISGTQSAFIPDRLITDNILIAAEVGHFLNRKQCGTVGWGALKLDMAKAYDRMEWSFLKGMLKALGFDERWVELIMICVTTVSYRFLINGSPSNLVTPTRANQYEAVEIKSCLARYEALSGQMVNYHKSSICYSKNTGSGDREMVVAQILGVIQAPNFGKYLGLPAFIGRNKKAAFAYIEDKIRQRIGSWNKKLLTQAAIERTMNRYWWGSGTDRGIRWKAWDRLCIPKKYGGLGFKDLKAFNLVMLGKQAWHFLTNTDSLDELDPMVQTEMPLQLADAKVAGLIDQTTGTWDPHILADIFQPNDVPRILKIPIPPEYVDTWYWYGDPNGCYSVKSGYRHIVGTYNTSMGFDKWNTLWHLKIPPKWKMFLWRAMSNILPTTTNLLIKRVEIDPTCAMCGLIHEDIMHSLVLCDYAKAIWSQSNLPIPQIVTNVFYDWFGALLNVLDSDAILFAAAILYNIWRAWNDAVWNAYLSMPKKVVATALAAVKAWQQLQTAAQITHVAAELNAPFPPYRPNLCYCPVRPK